MASLEKLEAEYCPPIDVALFTAIASDFDLSTAQGLADARTTLDSIKETALDEATDFEPSGVGERSEITDDTSVSTETDMNALDDETKVVLLHEVFGEHVDDATIHQSIRNCDGDWNAAMEELLTQVYCIEDRPVTKGIDGFAEPTKVKKKRRRRPQSTTSASDSDTASDHDQPKAWQAHQADIDFIASHIQVPVNDVRLKYHQNGASVPRTINAFLKEEMEKHVPEDDQTSGHARELGQDFPTIAPKYLLSLIRITSPSTAAAHELAKALVKRKETKIVPQYAPIRIDADEGVTARRTAISSTGFAAARAQAFAQASAAYRRSKSDRLYGGAAAYYSQLGRDLSSSLASSNSAAMDALASRQSSSNQLDLHGIDVANGVRIAKERTESWWASLGESRANGRLGAVDRSSGFAIVVGRGTHSEGGKSKLGPAVSKMLRNDGWKFNDEGPVLLVRGKAR